jgi:hypothetical protein
MSQSGDLTGRKRVPEVDFWRGFALVVILIDHVPKNIVDFCKLQNFGFSDAAEGFIFLSFSSLLGIATLGYQPPHFYRTSCLRGSDGLGSCCPISRFAQFDRGESIAGMPATGATLSGSPT